MSEDFPPARFAARYFDGLTAESHPAEAWVSADGVRVLDASGNVRRWAFDELTLMRGDGRDEPVQLERRSQPVEALIVPDRAFLGHLRAAMPARTRLGRGTGWAPGLAVVGGVLLAGLALLFALYRFAIPALADFAADRMPPAWERSYGDAVIAGLAPAEQRVTDARLLRPAQEIHGALMWTAATDTVEARLIALRSEVPNAYAAPGGNVVITTGLLRALRTPDELAAVVAHELGHVRRRHVTRALVRRLSIGVLLGLIAGDQSALSGGLQVAGELGALSYDRAHEREADDEALALLVRHGASPLALADALESIRRAAPSGPALGFLSTHPAPMERRARIRAAAEAAGATRGMPPWGAGAGWEEMKAALALSPAEGGARAPSLRFAGAGRNP